MLIDMHAHVIPQEIPALRKREDYPIPPYVEREEETVSALVGERSRFRAPSIWFSAERRLEAMSEKGVDTEVVSPMPSFLDFRAHAEDTLEMCRRVNEFVVTLCQSAPSAFVGLGLVPMQDLDLAAKELSEVAAAGLAGVEISSNINGVSPGESQFFDFFREVERLGLAVFVHGLNPTMGDRMPRSAAASFALGVEQTAAVTSIATGGLAEACPGLRLAFSHGGGGFAAMLPRAHYFWGGKWNEGAPDRPPVDKDGNALPSPFAQARKFYYDALLFDHRALRFVIDLLGADRIMVGTDFPAMQREDPAGATLAGMHLPADDLEKIYWRNCYAFLGREPGDA